MAALDEVVRDEARVRRAIEVLESERRRLAADLVMALTPADGGPAPDAIHQAASVYCQSKSLLCEAEQGLRLLLPKPGSAAPEIYPSDRS